MDADSLIIFVTICEKQEVGSEECSVGYSLWLSFGRVVCHLLDKNPLMDTSFCVGLKDKQCGIFLRSSKLTNSYSTLFQTKKTDNKGLHIQRCVFYLAHEDSHISVYALTI
ncbi:hypothetical protein VNO77_42638 [Canavalia gladiata]|uniref:Uncharacterized protein n=1 Tax=Canavalia gladiata TaxID=3824 RepID=A0AAN9JUV5_CANGL